MLKIIGVAFFALVIGVQVSGQVTTGAVIIAQDSPLTISHYTGMFNQTLRTADAAINQVTHLANILTNQGRMIQALSRGDWRGAVLAMEYANRSFENFNQFITDAEAIGGLEKITETLSFQELKDKSQKLGELMASTTELMWSTDDFVQSMEYRANQGEYILRKSRDVDSFVGQMQLVEQRLSLLQGGIDDVARLHMAQNRFLVAQQAEERHQELMADELNRRFFSDDDPYVPERTQEDYEDAVYGRNFMRAWDAAPRTYAEKRRREREEE